MFAFVKHVSEAGRTVCHHDNVKGEVKHKPMERSEQSSGKEHDAGSFGASVRSLEACVLKLSL